MIGVMLGTRMDNRVEGVRGWGVPAETIFEVCMIWDKTALNLLFRQMFSLPGLKLKKKSS